MYVLLLASWLSTKNKHGVANDMWVGCPKVNQCCVLQLVDTFCGVSLQSDAAHAFRFNFRCVKTVNYSILNKSWTFNWELVSVEFHQPL